MVKQKSSGGVTGTAQATRLVPRRGLSNAQTMPFKEEKEPGKRKTQLLEKPEKKDDEQ